MDLEMLVSVFAALGLLLSWALKNIEFIRARFAELSGLHKRYVVVGLCVLAGVAAFADQQELARGILGFLVALIGSQAGYTLFPEKGEG